MKRGWTLVWTFCLAAMLSACSSEPAVTETVGAEAAAADASSDPLTGTWTGDWGPTESHRNPVNLELSWDGLNLNGTVNPGPDAVALTKASYAPDTGMVMMEADAKDHQGAMVHFMIEGKVNGKAMDGTWSHGDKKGDFKVAKN